MDTLTFAVNGFLRLPLSERLSQIKKMHQMTGKIMFVVILMFNVGMIRILNWIFFHNNRLSEIRLCCCCCVYLCGYFCSVSLEDYVYICNKIKPKSRLSQFLYARSRKYFNFMDAAFVRIKIYREKFIFPDKCSKLT